VSRYQDTATEFRVLGKALTVNPKGWKYNHSVQSNVGLGAGDNEKSMQTLQGFYGIQQQLKGQGSTLTDDKDIYNTLSRMVEGAGFPRVSEFFNDPEEPVETLKAENEILNGMVVQLQEQMQLMQNPLAEAEEIKAQTSLIQAQGKAQLDLLSMKQDQEQFNREQAESRIKFEKELALKLTDLELKYSKDVPGALV